MTIDSVASSSPSAAPSSNVPPQANPTVAKVEKTYAELPRLSKERALNFAHCESRFLDRNSQVRVDIYSSGKDKPIVLFSHGFGVDSLCYHRLLEKLANEGYTVVAINHPSSTSGSYTGKEDEDPTKEIPKERFALMEKMQARNIQFVIDQIRGGELEGIGNASQIVLTGHSMGGVASLLASENQCVKGAINLDGGLTTGMFNPNKVLGKPVLTIHGDYSNEESCKPTVDAWNTFDRANETESVVIKGVNHMDFCYPYSVLTGRGRQAFKTEQIASKAMLQFMQKVFAK